MITLSIIGGILTAYFGWSGGRGDDYADKHGYPRWLFKSWTRDWIIAPLCALACYFYGVHSWWLILTIPLTGGALSTYWDWVYKDTDNFWMHGFFVGLAAFPIAIATGLWWMFAIRTLLLAVWMGGWSKAFSNPHLEDTGRYFIIGSTLWMLV